MKRRNSNLLESNKTFISKRSISSSPMSYKTCHHVACWALWAHTDHLVSVQTEIRGVSRAGPGGRGDLSCVLQNGKEHKAGSCAVPTDKGAPSLSPAREGFSPWPVLSLAGQGRWGGHWDGYRLPPSQHSAPCTADRFREVDPKS